MAYRVEVAGWQEKYAKSLSQAWRNAMAPGSSPGNTKETRIITG